MEDERLAGLETAVEQSDALDQKAISEHAAAAGKAQQAATSSTSGSAPTRPTEGRAYVVVQKIVHTAGAAVVRLGTVTAPTREGAWEQVQHAPDEWICNGLSVGEVVELGLLPESAWPTFRKLGARPRLEVL